ncbi:MAG: hypothetical protein OHK0057_04510 [Thermoflexibacter sp.]
MRKKVIHHPLYRKFDDFKEAIFHFFENIKDFRAELISWNFHIPELKPINLQYNGDKRMNIK